MRTVIQRVQSASVTIDGEIKSAIGKGLLIFLGIEDKDSEADIAIGVLNKLIDQELEAVRAATRDGNTPFGGYAQTRHNAFLYARDEIRKALADAMEERGAGNPFLPQRDELVTQDMHTCDLCGRWCSSPVYSIGLIYGGQAKTVTEVCADCMRRLKFQPVKTIPLDSYRLFEQWLLSRSEAEEETRGRYDR